jgi:hypothetical protein
MGLGEAKGTTIYTKGAAHRPPSHMTLMGEVRRGSERPKQAGNQIPGDPACKTGACGRCKVIAWLQHGVHVTTMCVALWQ